MYVCEWSHLCSQKKVICEFLQMDKQISVMKTKFVVYSCKLKLIKMCGQSIAIDFFLIALLYKLSFLWHIF